MIVVTEELVIRSEEIAYISPIKDRKNQLYWDKENKSYVYTTIYAFKVGLISGDSLIIEDTDLKKLNNTHKKLKSNID